MSLSGKLFSSIILSLTILAPIAFAESKEVVVPVDHYPPWKFADRHNAVHGIDIDLIQGLLSQLNLSPLYKQRPWKRCLAMMRDGHADLMSGILKRPEREEYMHFIEPPYKTTSTKAFYVRAGESVRIQRYEDLEELIVGVTLGVRYFPQFDADDTLNKVAVKDDLANIRKLVIGRIDTFIATEATADYLIYSLGFKEQIAKAHFSFAKHTEVYFAVSKKSPLAERLPELTRAVKNMVESGQVHSIISHSLEGL